MSEKVTQDEAVKEAVETVNTDETAECECGCEYCYIIYPKPRLQFEKTTGGRRWPYQSRSRKETR
jgi:hypothetical protein